ncbi:MAG TPA: threonine/serine dehydratase [Longimicrobiales bacterium]|nr:threonine/serine dehydratase [Longimicrobiales bacterium]
MTEAEGLVSLEDVEAAAERIRGVPVRTPLLPCPGLSETLGAEVRLKCESLQRTGSFKIRGAYHFVSRLPREDLERGVVTYSSGNHAQAMALAARLRDVRAVVVMPTTAPAVKVEGARRLGAEVVFEGTTSVERQRRAEAMAREQGLTVVPPFDHPDIIAGQGTVGLETAQEWPELDTFVVPVGGGGLASGSAVAIRALIPEARIVGVEPVGAASMRAALDADEVVELDGIDTIADGLAPVRAGELTFRHVRALGDDVATVEDEAIREAAAWLLTRRKLVVEFSGAATVGALRSGAVPVEGRRVAAVLSGGNLDPSLLGELLP